MNAFSESLVVTSTSKSNFPDLPQASELGRELNASDERCIASSGWRHEWTAIVIVCLCTFSLIMSPVVVTLVLSGSAESEGPAEEDCETTEGELVSAHSRRRRCEDYRDHNLRYQRSKTEHIYYSCSCTALGCVCTGHQLATGLAAPLLI